ncbi:hypothetical protein D9M71_671180 [compost metagenome]
MVYSKTREIRAYPEFAGRRIQKSPTLWPGFKRRHAAFTAIHAAIKADLFRAENHYSRTPSKTQSRSPEWNRHNPCTINVRPSAVGLINKAVVATGSNRPRAVINKRWR